MRNITYLLPLALLAGCATTTGQLAEREVAMRYQSSKPADIVAACIATNVTQRPVEAIGDDAFVTVRRNGYGMPLTRYDIKGGQSTTVEIKTNMIEGAGLSKVRACL
jgi:hypothetical protein